MVKVKYLTGLANQPKWLMSNAKITWPHKAIVIALPAPSFGIKKYMLATPTTLRINENHKYHGVLAKALAGNGVESVAATILVKTKLAKNA